MLVQGGVNYIEIFASGGRTGRLSNGSPEPFIDGKKAKRGGEAIQPKYIGFLNLYVVTSEPGSGESCQMTLIPSGKKDTEFLQ